MILSFNRDFRHFGTGVVDLYFENPLIKYPIMVSSTKQVHKIHPGCCNMLATAGWCEEFLDLN